MYAGVHARHGSRSDEGRGLREKAEECAGQDCSHSNSHIYTCISLYIHVDVHSMYVRVAVCVCTSVCLCVGDMCGKRKENGWDAVSPCEEG